MLNKNLNQSLTLTSVTLALSLAFSLSLSLSRTAHAADQLPDAFKQSSTLEMSVGNEQLSGDKEDWQSAYLYYATRLGPRQAMTLGLRRVRRFGLSDSQIEGGYGAPLNEQLSASIDVTLSPDHRILPRHSVSADLHYDIAPAWIVHGGFKHTSYDAVSVNQGVATIEHYIDAFRLAASWRLTRALNATTQSKEIRIDYYRNDVDRLGASVAIGREAFTAGLSSVAISDVKSLVINGHHGFIKDWALTYEISRTLQGDAYSKNGVSAGVRYAY